MVRAFNAEDKLGSRGEKGGSWHRRLVGDAMWLRIATWARSRIGARRISWRESVFQP